MRTICLPFDLSHVDDSTFVAGWGRTTQGKLWRPINGTREASTVTPLDGFCRQRLKCCVIRAANSCQSIALETLAAFRSTTNWRSARPRIHKLWQWALLLLSKLRGLVDGRSTESKMGLNDGTNVRFVQTRIDRGQGIGCFTAGQSAHRSREPLQKCLPKLHVSQFQQHDMCWRWRKNRFLQGQSVYCVQTHVNSWFSYLRHSLIHFCADLTFAGPTGRFRRTVDVAGSAWTVLRHRNRFVGPWMRPGRLSGYLHQREGFLEVDPTQCERKFLMKRPSMVKGASFVQLGWHPISKNAFC